MNALIYLLMKDGEGREQTSKQTGDHTCQSLGYVLTLYPDTPVVPQHKKSVLSSPKLSDCIKKANDNKKWTELLIYLLEIKDLIVA